MNCNDVPTSRQEDAVVRASARRTLNLGPKGMRKELLSPDEVTGIQMMRIEIRPGGSLGRGKPQRERREMQHRNVRHAGALCASRIFFSVGCSVLLS